MVGKLIKHELWALFRIILFVGIGAIVVALLGRIIYAADSESIYGVLFSLLAVYAAGIGLVMAFFASVAQFSRSFFTGEGYMTFSLPATPSQILIAKLVSAFVAMFYGLLVTAISILIFLSGIEPEYLEAFRVVFGELWDIVTNYLASEPLLIFELVLLAIVSLPLSLLFFYLVISVGQLFTGGRKGLTFVIAIAAIILVSILNSYAFQPLLDLCLELDKHFYLWVEILVYAALDVGMFFAIRYILTHKVNLIV